MLSYCNTVFVCVVRLIQCIQINENNKARFHMCDSLIYETIREHVEKSGPIHNR